jgi:uncharacterized protein
MPLPRSSRSRWKRPRRIDHEAGIVKAALVMLALWIGAAAPAALAQIALPPLEGRVTDLTGTLTAQQQSALEDRLAAFEKRKGAQVAVLILPTTEPETIEQFGVRLLESWKLGRKGVDDGVALIVAKDDRALRIEVQYGLEGVLNDATSKRIIEEAIVPRFRQGDFAGGIDAGVDRILGVIEGETLPAPDPSWPKDEPAQVNWLVLMFVGFWFAMLARQVLGRLPAAALGGAGAGGLGYLLSGQLLLALGIGVGTLVFALATGGGSRRRAFRRGGWGGFGGGFGSGGFGGGFGGGLGGGFGGGGGRGGGGGASGRW